MGTYDFGKSIKKGISGGIRTAICGGGAMATQTGIDLNSAIATFVSFLVGFIYSAGKNYLKNKRGENVKLFKFF